MLKLSISLGGVYSTRPLSWLAIMAKTDTVATKKQGSNSKQKKLSKHVLLDAVFVEIIFSPWKCLLRQSWLPLGSLQTITQTETTEPQLSYLQTKGLQDVYFAYRAATVLNQPWINA